MLNQVAVEALYSATYVENYLDCVENLPDDLQRHLTRMRELDVSYRACLRDVEGNLDNCLSAKDSDSTPAQSNKRTRAIARIQQALIAAQELGDEKLQVVQLLQDLIDHKYRQLDLDYRNLVSCLDYGNGSAVKEEAMAVDAPSTTKDNGVGSTPGSGSTQQPSSGNGGQTSGPPPTPPHNPDRDRDRNDKDRTGERASKRARRSRADTGAGNEASERGDRDREQAPPPAPPPSADPPQRTTNNSNSNAAHKKTAAAKIGTGKKKKRKSRQSAAQASQRDDTPPPEDPDPIDPDEPTYCLCDQISFGEMILCDNDLCPIEWFHFSCVSLTTKPKGKWFCPKCRGDRPNVMKPKSQFLKELERYNKEKEEKA